MRKILENIRKLVEDKIGKKIPSVIPQNFRFNQELHHPNFTLVDDQTVRVSDQVSFGATLL